MTITDNRVTRVSEAVSQVSMRGGGHYNANCRPQASDVEAATSFLAEAARSVSRTRDGLPVMIADYGCAEGKNSRRVSDILKRSLLHRHPYVSIFRNDLAGNDFSGILKSTEQNGSSAGGLKEFEFVRPGSFYEPVMPPNSVNIACCFAALHWVSETPALDGSFAPFGCEVSPELRSRFARLASEDWRQFLHCRAEELSVGGKLVVSFVGREAGEDRVHGPIELLRCAARQLAREGTIHEENLKPFVFPVYRRTVEEVLAPLREKNSDLSRQLRLQRYSEQPVSCPLLSAIRSGTDPAVAAQRYVRFIRAFSEPTICSGLFAGDDPSVVAGKLNQLYSLMERLAAADPERFQLRRTRLLLLIQASGNESPGNPWPHGLRKQPLEKRNTRVGELSV